MSATSAEDESGTVREEGMCGEDKVAKGKQSTVTSEVSAMSPQAHTLSPLRSQDTVPSSPDIFDRSFSTRSSVGDSSPFRKFNISPPPDSFLLLTLSSFGCGLWPFMLICIGFTWIKSCHMKLLFRRISRLRPRRLGS